MKYKNTKTGAIIDSPCRISGGDWIPYEKGEQKEVPKVEEVDASEEKADEIETAENNESINGVTKKQIMQELDAMGVKYNRNDNKETLYNLMIGK